MDDFAAIDVFLATFVTYIDSGFGLITGDVVSLAAILIVIDVTLAALFWAWGQNTDVIQSLVKKTLYVGAFAFILGNFTLLANIVFESFATLGLTASGAGFAPADLLRPGLVAAEGIAASQPIFDYTSEIAPGMFEFFDNLPQVLLLMIGGFIVIGAFFVLSIQLFVLVVEFKLTTLAGFVLVPFAFWKQTTFLAERVLGHVIASGVKVLVIAVVIGIGSSMFAALRTALDPADMTISQAFAVVLGALTLTGLAVFCPRIAAGLVSGAPQLSGGAAVGTTLGIAGTVAASIAAIRATSSGSGPGAGLISGLISGPIPGGGRAALPPPSNTSGSSASASERSASQQPEWAKRFRQQQTMREGAMMTAHALRDGDSGGASEGPSLKQRQE